MSLAVSGYMKQFYKGNIFGATEGGRKGHNIRSLISADMYATSRALKDLRGLDYNKKIEESEKDELDKQVQAYVNTYNNYFDSTSELDHEEVDRVLSKLKKMTKSKKEELEAIGIKMQSNGRLKVDKDTLEKASSHKIGSIFSGKSEYGMQVEKHMKKIQTLIRRNNLGIPRETPARKPEQDEEDAKLAGKLVEALAGRQVNQSV